MKNVNIAIIGIGDISGIYLQNITNVFKEITILGVCDLKKERALKAQETYGIEKVYDVMDDAFADPDVDIVLNLTRPHEHYAVSLAALTAGKHVYSEKPLAASFEEGKHLVELATNKNLMLGGAPDTYLGAAIQTCRKLIDDGMIGDVIASTCAMVCHGHESWHPDPAFYYQYGGGPMMDMGPYYVTALINLIGGAKGVTGVAKKSFPARTITSAPKSGEIVDVEVNTHVTGIIDFENGATGTITTTFDVHYNSQARFEIYGTKGTLLVPDPNNFDGEIQLLRPEDGEYSRIPLMFAYKENSRALGLADMAKALQCNRSFRSDCEQTLHVLEIMTAFDKSSEQKAYYPLTTSFTRKAPMADCKIKGILEA